MFALRMFTGDARQKAREEEKKAKEKEAKERAKKEHDEHDDSTIFKGSHKKSSPLNVEKVESKSNKRKKGDVKHEHDDGDEKHGQQGKGRRTGDVNDHASTKDTHEKNKLNPTKQKYASVWRRQQEARDNRSADSKQGEGSERGSEAKTRQSEKLVRGALASLRGAFRSFNRTIEDSSKVAAKPEGHIEHGEQADKPDSEKGAGKKEEKKKLESKGEEQETFSGWAVKALGGYVKRHFKQYLDPKFYAKETVNNIDQYARTLRDRLSQITGGSGSPFSGNNKPIFDNSYNEDKEEMKQDLQEAKASLKKSLHDNKLPTLPEEEGTKAKTHVDAHVSHSDGASHEHTHTTHEEEHQEPQEHHEDTAKKDHDEPEKQKDHDEPEEHRHPGDNTERAGEEDDWQSVEEELQAWEELLRYLKGATAGNDSLHPGESDDDKLERHEDSLHPGESDDDKREQQKESKRLGDSTAQAEQESKRRGRSDSRENSHVAEGIG